MIAAHPSARRDLARILAELMPVTLALVLGLSVAPNVLADDAAISFRYADRLAAGAGLTYNDHERVFGVSNPLYVLLLTTGRWCGQDLELTGRVIGIVAFCWGLWLAGRIAGDLAQSSAAATVTGLILGLDSFFRYNELSGMESCLSVVLGLGTVRALQTGRQERAGWLLGLAVVNKLDAVLLGLAVVLASRVALSSWPWRALARAAVPIAAWSLFATAYFGAPIPHSFVMKVTGRVPDQPFDRWSVAKLFSYQRRYLLIPGVFACLGNAWHFADSQRLVALTLAIWFSLHAAVLSTVDFGAAYPWYRVVLFPPLIILSGAWLGISWRARRSHPIWMLASGAAVALVLWSLLIPTAIELSAGNQARSWEQVDLDRRSLGKWLAEHSRPDEVVHSGFGWIAFPLRNPFHDLTGLNSVASPGPAAYLVHEGRPGRPPTVPAGFERLLLVGMAHETHPEAIWFELYGTADSAIGKTGLRTVLLSEYQAGIDRTASSSGMRWVGADIYVPTSSRVRFVLDGLDSGAQLLLCPALPQGATGEDGTVFEVAVNGRSSYRAEVLQGARAAPVRVSPLPTSSVVELKTTPRHSRTSDVGYVQWQLPRVVIRDYRMTSPR
jgi:hypothetical protein